MRNTMNQSHTPSHTRQRQRQQGVSLIIVMVMMLLSLLLVLGGSRVGLLNERVSGNSTDYQRAYEAAEALLGDARLDIACMTGGCANRAAVTQFTCDASQFFDLQAVLGAQNPPCADGICMDLGIATNGAPTTSFWRDAWLATSPNWTAYTTGNRGARFGQYTGTVITAANAVNPLLLNRSWYWIEILRYGASGGGGRSVAGEQSFVGQQTVKPDVGCEFVFRVTAAAQGRKTGTTAVLQSLYLFRPTT